MPAARTDNNGRWKYDTNFPGANLKQNPQGVSSPALVESIGVDGRFVGAIRPFPGMGDKTIHGLGDAASPLTGITHVQYVSIQDGMSSTTLRGLAFIADASSGGGKALWFVYRDGNGADQTEELLAFNARPEHKLATYGDRISITSTGRYLYLVASGIVTSTSYPFIDGQASPYNIAVYKDFKVNRYDPVGDPSGFRVRLLGSLPKRCIAYRFNRIVEDGDPSGAQSSGSILEGQIQGTGGGLLAGPYTLGIELVSRKHQLRSPIRWASRDVAEGGTSDLKLGVRINPGANPNETSEFHNTTSRVPERWGIGVWDGVRIWRTAKGLPLVGGGTVGTYELSGELYLLKSYFEEEIAATLGSEAIFYWGVPAPRNNTDVAADSVYSGQTAREYQQLPDEGLLAQTQHDTYLDEWGSAPKMRLVVQYEGLLVGISDVTQPDNPSQDWEYTDQWPEEIVWSSMNSNEIENFPVANYHRVQDPGEHFWALESAGDHLFAISTGGVYKLTRSGSQMSVNRLQFRLGGVGRYSQTGVGNSLYMVTKAGVKEIDGNTGEIQSITALDRLINDDSEWAPSLGSIWVEYDATVGAIILLNTAKKEAVLIWENTGAITKIEDCPWTFLTAGPDIKTNGPQRAYWVMPDGSVHCMDGAREMGKRSMCGMASDEIANAVATTPLTTTRITVTSSDVIPRNCVGHLLYILSGDLAETSTEITARVDDNTVDVVALSSALDAGDRVSISPVHTRITLAQLMGEGGQVNPFQVKIATGMAASMSDTGGELSSSATNKWFTMGVRRGTTVLDSTEVLFNERPDKAVGRVNARGTRLYPFLEMFGGNQDWELQGVLVHGILSGSEAEGRQV